ncbi:MAG: hypothetical protein ACXW3J_06605, partial [Methylocystis sp.]
MVIGNLLLRDGPLNNLFKSVILTTNEIKLCSDHLASFVEELRQALQICRGALWLSIDFRRNAALWTTFGLSG